MNKRDFIKNVTGASLGLATMAFMPEGVAHIPKADER
jgi:hypothetical protein